MITVKKKKTTFLKYPFSQKLQSSSFYVKKLFNFCSQKRSKVWFSLQITFLMCYHHKKIPWDEYPFPQGTIFFFQRSVSQNEPNCFFDIYSIKYICTGILVWEVGFICLFILFCVYVCVVLFFCFLFFWGFFESRSRISHFQQQIC